MTPTEILDALIARKVVRGCVDSSPLLERWTILSTPIGKLRLHHFLRSDEDRELHDHPWSYVSLIVAGGYTEEIAPAAYRQKSYRFDPPLTAAPQTERHWRRAGSLLFRSARWMHRIEIAPGRDAWTLIWMTRRSRTWGFFTGRGWIRWDRYVASAACVDDAAAGGTRRMVQA